MADSLLSLLGGGDVVMWKVKGCPRCGGDLFIDRDLDSWYEQCLQCAYQHELRNIVEFKEQPAQKEGESASARGHRLKRRFAL